MKYIAIMLAALFGFLGFAPTASAQTMTAKVEASKSASGSVSGTVKWSAVEGAARYEVRISKITRPGDGHEHSEEVIQVEVEAGTSLGFGFSAPDAVGVSVVVTALNGSGQEITHASAATYFR